MLDSPSRQINVGFFITKKQMERNWVRGQTCVPVSPVSVAPSFLPNTVSVLRMAAVCVRISWLSSKVTLLALVGSDSRISTSSVSALSSSSSSTSLSFLSSLSSSARSTARIVLSCSLVYTNKNGSHEDIFLLPNHFKPLFRSIFVAFSPRFAEGLEHCS